LACINASREIWEMKMAIMRKEERKGLEGKNYIQIAI
jgi:hypothetical protein